MMDMKNVKQNLKQRLTHDIMKEIKPLENDLPKYLQKEVGFYYTVVDNQEDLLIDIILEVFILERFNKEDDEGLEFSITFHYENKGDFIFNEEVLLFYGSYGRRKPLWVDMDSFTVNVNDFDGELYDKWLNDFQQFVIEFKEFAIHEINEEY